MVIMGIDPGTRRTGYAIVEASTEVPYLLACGSLTPSPRLSFAERLLEIYRGILEIVTRFRPDEMAVESVFVKHNVSAALKMGHMRGVALLAAALNDIDVAEYSPAEVKQSVVGSGAASKDQVKFMVVALLRLADSPSEDEADALAVALCHVHRRKLNEVSPLDILHKRYSC
jgi:crossover junction endodeoxyribonuclease RuvC